MEGFAAAGIRRAPFVAAGRQGCSCVVGWSGSKRGSARVRSRLVGFILIIQSILFVTHAFLYETWVFFWAPAISGISALRIAFFFSSVSFVVASVLSFRFYNPFARLFYTLSAAWLGIGSFCVWSSCLCWVVYVVLRIGGIEANRRDLALFFLALAVLAGVCGIANAARTRVRQIAVTLPNLPVSWRGRTAALVTDMHLGPVRGVRFSRRIAALVTRLKPGVVFISGDFYDGTAADLKRLAEPWSRVSAPFGAYFVTGNHEEFTDRSKYLAAVSGAGIRVLNDEKIVLDGLQLVGVHDRESGDPAGFRAILERANLDRNCASVLLVHTPHRLVIPETESVSLQLSGHTHGGQFWPYTWITSRIYGKFVHGLQRFGNLQVYTSYGAGTWGPPMRVGTWPEIVLIRFE